MSQLCRRRRNFDPLSPSRRATGPHSDASHTAFRAAAFSQAEKVSGMTESWSLVANGTWFDVLGTSQAGELLCDHRCPITTEIMTDPVTAEDGIT